MSEPMKQGITTDDAHKWLDVDHDLTDAEDREAEATAGDRLQRQPRAHVERSERHVMARCSAQCGQDLLRDDVDRVGLVPIRNENDAIDAGRNVRTQ